MIYDTVIPDDSRSVEFKAEGDCELIGYNSIEAEAGIASILLKVGDSPGTIKITATAQGVQEGNIEVVTSDQ